MSLSTVRSLSERSLLSTVPIPADSNGEMIWQICEGAIALLWGLARASGRRLPMAIDTPLGRLDSSHRNNLVEKYFPQASHQVILLSTDTEICSKEVNQLREQGVISHEYLLEYDRTRSQTTLTTGYFW